MNFTGCACVSALLFCWLSCSQVADIQEGTDKIGDGTREEKMVVAAAANLRFVLEDLKTDFEKNRGVELEIIYGSSGKLTSQIINGAPFDLFLSANMKFPQKLVSENLTSGPPVIYALGTLIMWTSKDIDLSIGLNRLLEDDIQKIAIATDKNAPYGSAALEALKSAGLYSILQHKLIYGESVSQVNQYVKSESVDVGLTNKSVVFRNMKNDGVWQDVDTALYSNIAQGVVVTKQGYENRAQDCETFLSYLLTPSAQTIFAKYGYLAP